MTRQADYVLRTVEERGIRFIRLWFTDVQGFLKSVSISPAELEVAFEEGMTFDGSAIDGYARVQEADMMARPDPSTFTVLPWREEQQVARMFCDIYTSATWTGRRPSATRSMWLPSSSSSTSRTPAPSPRLSIGGATSTSPRSTSPRTTGV